MPSVHRLSFRATGTPASGPGSSPARTIAIDVVGVGHRPFPIVTSLKQCRSPSSSRMRSRDWREKRPGAEPTGTHRGGDLGEGREFGGGGRCHGASPMMRGTRKRSALGQRCLGEHGLAIEAGDRGVRTEHVLDRERVGRRGHVGGVETAHGIYVLEDGGQLRGACAQPPPRRRRAGRGAPRDALPRAR